MTAPDKYKNGSNHYHCGGADRVLNQSRYSTVPSSSSTAPSSSSSAPSSSSSAPSSSSSAPSRSSFVMRNIRQIAAWITSRMGSFSSAIKIPNEDKADSDLSMSSSLTWEDVLNRCRSEVAHWPPLITRRFITCPLKNSQINDGSDEFQVASKTLKDSSVVRIFQWNVLSEALGKVCGNDNFVACPEAALEWKFRRWRLLEEIVTVQPDILCLQEVDHFKFLQTTLAPLGFEGIFCPKPDSPCIYVVGNNGPDGCAIFWNENEWELVRSHERTLEVWGCTSNQVAIFALLRRKQSHHRRSMDRVLQNEDSTRNLAVATTHLKARQGPLLPTLRHEQGKDLLRWVRYHCPTDCPLVMSGDFNAEPTEPVYNSVLSDPVLSLDSSYASAIAYDYEKSDPDRAKSNNGKTLTKSEPPYTTWKIRGEGEDCHTIDYVFYSKNSLIPERVLALPSESDVGPGRTPSYQYPSDHFSLVTDFRFAANDAN